MPERPVALLAEPKEYDSGSKLRHGVHNMILFMDPETDTAFNDKGVSHCLGRL